LEAGGNASAFFVRDQIINKVPKDVVLVCSYASATELPVRVMSLPAGRYFRNDAA